MTFDHSTVDIVCWYVDYGRNYGPLIERMTSSAKKHMPGCRTVMLTPKHNQFSKYFDIVYGVPESTGNPRFLCLERGRAHVSWMVNTKRPAILIDPDVEILKPAPFGDWDIGLNWRDKPDQPVNSGAVLAFPGHQAFWLHYGKVTANLPKSLWGWWCDQLAFSLLTGVCHQAGDVLTLDGSRVALLDSRSNCATDGAEADNPWAVHYKGRRKGEGWEDVFLHDPHADMPAGIISGGVVT